MESFNAALKRMYNFGVRHTLPALFDILEHLIRDLSLDVISGRKAYETLHRPQRNVIAHADLINPTTHGNTINDTVIW